MKQRIIAMMAGFVALFALSSCLEVEQVLSLNKDGSGTITEEVVMGAQMVAMMEGGLGGAGGENPLQDMYDEKQYKEKASAYGEGVKFSKLEKIERNGGKGVKVTYTFADINKVKFSPGSAMDDFNQDGGDDEEEDAEDPVTFKYAGGELQIIFPKDIAGEGGEGGDEEEGAEDAAAEAMMMQMFKDMKMAAKLKIPSGIAKTNATHVDGDTITIMEMNFGEIIQNPDGIKALKKLDAASRAELGKALEGVKGVKIELKEKVNVTVK